MNKMIFALLCLTSAAFAEDGFVDYVDGIVDLKINGIVGEALVGDRVPEGTSIITGADSTAIIGLSDGTEIKLRGNSEVQMIFNNSSVNLALNKGSVFAFVDPDEKRPFEIRTETTVAGVRGTEFFMSYGRLIEENPDIWLCVNMGVVEVAVEGRDETVSVEAGEGITIPGGERLTDPRFYEWTTELNWNTDPEAGSVMDETDLDGAYADLLDQDYF